MNENLLYQEIGNRRIRRFNTQVIDGEEVLVETEDWIQYQGEQEFKLALRRSNLVLGDYVSLDQYQGKDTSGNIPKLRDYIKRYDRDFKSINLYLYSELNSTQKTTVSKIVGRELLKTGHSVFFTVMDELVKKLTKEGFDDQDTEYLETIRSCDFLIIDDSFDARKVTIYKSGYQLSFLDSFLRNRLETERKSTCFTSNISIKDIQTTFDRHIAALVDRSTYEMPFNDSIDDFDIKTLWD